MAKDKKKKKKPEKSVVAVGKTKTIYAIPGDHRNGEFVSNDNITKFDDPDQTVILPKKGIWANTTTCNVLQLLKDAGLPVAFNKKTGRRSFTAPLCDMINLEVIIRRNPVGSYLKRRPDLKQSEDASPPRNHALVFELFLKTTGGKVINRFDKRVAKLPKIPSNEKGLRLDDPFIANPYEEVWQLYQPKVPMWEGGAAIDISIPAADILPPGVTVAVIEEIARKAFLVVEAAWAIAIGDRLIDWKIEFGISPEGELLIADVIDNDSWRKRNRVWQETSKQLFRDNETMDWVAFNYKEVAELSDRLRIPQQALVVWRGSDKDPLLEDPGIPGVDFISVVCSAHKSTRRAMNHLDKIMNEYPEGGVIIAEVGMSNGLGPTVSSRTHWPVISWAVSSKGFPEDIWSSVRMPSFVPNLTAMAASNAILAALNILSLKNPVAAMKRLYAIEQLDD